MPEILPTFSIVIVTYNRTQLLNSCLQSVFRQIENSESIDKSLEKIILVYNGCKIENQYDNTKISTVHLESRCTPARARNIAMQKVHSKYTLFIDDDCILCEDYLQKSLEILSHSGADVLGGPDQPYPQISILEKVLNLTLQSPMATLCTRKRHKRGNEPMHLSDEKCLTLCNLWVSSSGFKRHYFSDQFMRGEENELLQRWKPEKAIYSSQIYVLHKRRDQLSSILEATYKSGFFRARLIAIHGLRNNLPFLIPTLTTLLVSVLLVTFPMAAIFLITAYLFSSLAFSVQIAGRLFVRVTLMQIMMNFAYMFGFTFGALSCLLPSSHYRSSEIAHHMASGHR